MLQHALKIKIVKLYSYTNSFIIEKKNEQKKINSFLFKQKPKNVLDILIEKIFLLQKFNVRNI